MRRHMIMTVALVLVVSGCTQLKGVLKEKPVEEKHPFNFMTISIYNSEQPTKESVKRYKFWLDNNSDYGFYPPKGPINNNSLGVKLCRYDFVEYKAEKNALYATLLVQTAETQPTLIPNSHQPNKILALLFLRQGKPVRLVDTQSVLSYRDMPESTIVNTMIPGLDFPVGGVTLLPATINDKDSKQIASDNKNSIIAGNTGRITDISSNCDCGYYPPNVAATLVDCKRVTNDCADNSEWDLLFAWQPTAEAITPTHSINYQESHSTITGDGFFTTMEPFINSGNRKSRPNLMNTYFPKDVGSLWILGWLVDVHTIGSIQAGQCGDTWNQPLPDGTVNAKLVSYLAGIMHPDAKVTRRQDATDRPLKNRKGAVEFSGSYMPLIARSRDSRLPGKLSQLIVSGRTFWLQQNDIDLDSIYIKSDQVLDKGNRYGTILSLDAYLPVR